MAGSKTLEVLLVGKDKGALQLLGGLGDKSDESASKLDRMDGRFTAAGAAMVGAGGLMLGAFVKAAEAGEEANKAHLKLDNTMANAPSLAGANKQAFLDQATALQKVTTADDEAVISIQAMLGQFGETQSQVTELTPLVVDLAQKLGVDFDTAAKMVGKSVEGSAGALKKAGIEVDANAFATNHYTATVDALRKTVGGFAEQEGKTFSGQMAIMGNQLHDIEEGIGVGAAAAFSNLLKPVQSLSQSFTEMEPSTQSLIGQIGTYTSVGLLAAGATSSLIGFVIKARENFSTAASGVASMVRGLGTLDGAIRTISFASAAAGVALLTYQLKKNGDEAKSWAGKTTNLGSGTIQEQIDRTKKALKEGEDALRNYASLDFGDSLHIFGSNEGRAQADKVNQLKDQLAALESQEKSGKDSAELQARGIDSMGNAVSTATPEVDDLTLAQDKNTAATKKGADAYDKALQSLRGYFDEAMGRVDTERQLSQAHDDLSRTIAQNGIYFTNMTQQGRDNRKAFEDAGKAAVDWGISQIQAGQSAQAAAFGVNLQIESLRQQMYQAGFSKAAVDAYITSLHLTPTDIITSFQQPGLAQAKADLQEVLALEKALGPLGTTSVGAWITGRNRLPAGAPTHAQGAYYPARTGGSLATVAEAGQAEWVLPDDKLKGALAAAGGGGGVNVYLTVQGSVHTERDLVESVRNGVIAARRRTGQSVSTYFGG